MFVCIINFINFAEITNYISTMLNKILIIITLLCSPIVISAQNIFDTNPDYIEAGQSSHNIFYINTKTIKKDDDGYHVWLAIYSYNNRIKTRSHNTRSNKRKISRKNLYSLDYIIIDLDESKSKIVSSVDYDNKGNILRNVNCDYSEWSYTVPGSVFEAVIDTFKQYISDNPIE